MKKNIAELIGWSGTAMLIGAYALLSFTIISSTSLTYQLLNLCGATGILVVALKDKDKQSATIQLFWMLITLVALARLA